MEKFSLLLCTRPKKAVMSCSWHSEARREGQAMPKQRSSQRTQAALTLSCTALLWDFI